VPLTYLGMCVCIIASIDTNTTVETPLCIGCLDFTRLCTVCTICK